MVTLVGRDGLTLLDRLVPGENPMVLMVEKPNVSDGQFRSGSTGRRRVPGELAGLAAHHVAPQPAGVAAEHVARLGA